MNTREFLEAIWPAAGPFCIARPWVTPEGKNTYAHKAFHTIEDVVTYVAENRTRYDIYFAVHTLKVAQATNPQTGKLKTYRTHENMREARAFFFDVDVGANQPGETKKYETAEEAKAALDRFLFATNLPTPFVVSSGGGLHVYWALSDPIDSAAWREPADKLHWLAKRHGLRVDPARTTDQSSVLRVPNTYNMKDPDNPRKVRILLQGVTSDSAGFLSELEDKVGDQYAPLHYSPPAKSASGEPVGWTGRLTPVAEIVEVCEQIRQFRDTRGCVPEPHWHAGIGVLKYAEDGPATIHDWSSGHPRYSPGETQTKIDLWKLYPPTCDKIRSVADPVVCDRCAFSGLGKNPLAIANKVWEQSVAPPPAPAAGLQMAVPASALIEPPWPYLRRTAGIFQTRSSDEEGKGPKEIKICDYDIFPILGFEALDAEQGFSRWIVTLPMVGQRTLDIANHHFSDWRALLAFLYNKGVIVKDAHGQRMLAFMKAYMQELQKNALYLQQYDHVGWDMKPGSTTPPEGFILFGRKLDMAGKVHPIAMSKTTDDVRDALGKGGDMQTQIDLMEFYNHDAFMAHQFLIGLALATPLFRFTNQHGVVVNMASEQSGVSKTTAAQFCSALWGHPEYYMISGLKSGSTEKARYERVAILRNLPFILDETTLIDSEILREVVMSVGQPGDLKVLNKERQFRAPRRGVKAFTMICTSNNSMVQRVNYNNTAGQAATARIFEMMVRRSLVRSKAEADQVVRVLCQNYGWIGEDFMSKILPHIDAVGAGFIKQMTRFEKAINVTPDERFMSGAAATGLYGIYMGHRLGYLPFDYKKMEEWLIEVQVPTMRSVASSEQSRREPETALSDYLEEINGNTARVEVDSGGNIGAAPHIPHGDLKAHLDVTNQEIWVRLEPFRIYCTKLGYDYVAVLRELHSLGIVTDMKCRRTLALHTSAAKARVVCFVVNMRAAGVQIAPPPPVEDPDSTVVQFKPRGRT